MLYTCGEAYIDVDAQTMPDAATGWSVGETILIPSPDNALVQFRLTVLEATEWGEYTIVDEDGDVFSCAGTISQDACQYAGLTCPTGVRYAARLPEVGAKAIWMCEEN